jgi:choline-sulfatase
MRRTTRTTGKTMTTTRRTTRRTSRLLASWALLLAAACAGREPSPTPAAGAETAPLDTTATATTPADATTTTPEPEATAATTADTTTTATTTEKEGTLVVYDLVTDLPLAEVAAPGLRLDFGTGRTLVPMLGRWRTGWGRDGEDDGRTVTVAARSPVRLYLPADAIRGTTMRVTAKALGGRRITADVADESLGDANTSTVEYGTADFAIPESLAGNVTLKLTFRGSGRHPTLGRGTALIDRIDFLTPEQVAATGTAEEPLTARPATDSAPAALRQAAATTIRYHLYVPLDATLLVTPAADGAETTAAIRAVRDAGEPVELLAAKPVAAAGEAQEIPLTDLAGTAVRLELIAGDGGAVRWSAPQIVVPDRGGSATPSRTARNLVILLVDTLRADKLSSINASTEVKADNLQRWAAEGVSFDRAHVQENWTKPSVATLLTGLYPSSHAAQSERSVLPPEAELVSEVLKGEGFATACLIANGYVSDAFGFRRGWDMYRNYVRGGLPNRAQYVFGDAAAWIRERSADERFFLYIQTIDPHVPYAPPREFYELYDPDAYDGPVKASETSTLLERVKSGQVTLNARDRVHLEALYDGEISYHDAHAPLLWDALAETGVLDDTLVVVTADHGEEFFEHGSVGHGHSLFEELLHVPLFFRLPGVFDGGRQLQAIVGLVDVLPTALETLGLPPQAAAQGRSLLPLAAGSATGAEVAFTEFLEGQRAVTGERYKLIQRGYRSMLYDLREDAGEERDAAADAPIALRAMFVRLAAYLEWQERAGRDELRPRPAQEAQIDTELEEQLRALGYLGGPTPH